MSPLTVECLEPPLPQRLYHPWPPKPLRTRPLPRRPLEIPRGLAGPLGPNQQAVYCPGRGVTFRSIRFRSCPSRKANAKTRSLRRCAADVRSRCGGLCRHRSGKSSRLQSHQRPHHPPGQLRFHYSRQPVFVKHYYFYLDDPDFGEAFVKVCTYAPWAIKVCLNGHEWGQAPVGARPHCLPSFRQWLRPMRRSQRLQQLCDQLGPSTSKVS